VPSAWQRRKRLYAAVLAGALLITTLGFAVGRGLGAPSVPSGDVALVQDAPDGHISQAEFNRALVQAAARQGVKQVPKPGDQGYDTLRDLAMSDVILTRWVQGEAEERGISVSDTEVSDQLNQIIKQQFQGQAGFQTFLKKSHFTEAEARQKVALNALSQHIQDAVLPQNPSVSDTDIKNFYEQNKSQFQKPETRDFRVISNPDQAQVEKAKSLLEQDDSAANWAKVAQQYSTDPSTKKSGGLRKNVAKGQSEPALDTAIFQAPDTGVLIGPVKGDTNYFLIEVEKVTPATTAPLDSQLKDQIKQQLASAQQQQIASAFQTDFIDKWTSRTFCASGYVTDRCENFTPTTASTCTGSESDDTLQCGAYVVSTRPVAPGAAGVIGATATQGLPQGPLQPVAPVPTGVPGQTVPLGPGGAPTPPSQPAPSPGG
jgi:parvulin-like peptidyl-prolyl isomerase